MENAIGAVCYCHGSVLFADLADATGPFAAVFLAAMGNRRQIVMELTVAKALIGGSCGLKWLCACAIIGGIRHFAPSMTRWRRGA